MRDDLRLYLRYIGVSLRAQMEYRTSFVLVMGGALLNTVMEFLAILALFQRFGSLRGWRLPEVALLWGMIQVSSSVADAFGRGFDQFANQVRTGDFDRLLLRPRSTALQVVGHELTLFRVGRLLPGLVVLGWALARLEIAWTPERVLLVPAAVAGGAALFLGLLVVQATLSFWTIEGLEIMNAVTYGGVETAQYPLTIYRDWFRGFFTWMIPLACANFLPAHALLGRPAPSLPPFSGAAPDLMLWLSPVAGFLFLGLALQAWKLGVRHYCSTGS